jgi:hypothetical protein
MSTTKDKIVRQERTTAKHPSFEVNRDSDLVGVQFSRQKVGGSGMNLGCWNSHFTPPLSGTPGCQTGIVHHPVAPWLKSLSGLVFLTQPPARPSASDSGRFAGDEGVPSFNSLQFANITA